MYISIDLCKILPKSINLEGEMLAQKFGGASIQKVRQTTPRSAGAGKNRVLGNC